MKRKRERNKTHSSPLLSLIFALLRLRRCTMTCPARREPAFRESASNFSDSPHLSLANSVKIQKRTICLLETGGHDLLDLFRVGAKNDVVSRLLSFFGFPSPFSLTPVRPEIKKKAITRGHRGRQKLDFQTGLCRFAFFFPGSLFLLLRSFSLPSLFLFPPSTPPLPPPPLSLSPKVFDLILLCPSSYPSSASIITREKMKTRKSMKK